MRINLLGSCQVIWQDRPLALPRRQTRALLYLLAARLEPVARARIAFLFWPDEPDAVARRQLTRLLSSLRAALPQPDLLRVDEDSVALDPTLVRSDSQQLAAAGAADNSAILEAAVALYRGPFMVGFSLPGAPEFEAWQTQTARLLETHYLTLVERLVTLYVTEADVPSAIRCAQRYLASDELAETMHRTLIGLFMAAGDRAAALRQYELCALLLERELGVSPLPETRAALQAAPAPRPAIALPVQPSPEPPLTGREAALAQLQQAHDRLSRGGLILIHGAPGAGKTRLLREFATGSSRQGSILAGSSYPGSQSLPYHPLLQALRGSFDQRELWRAVPTAWLSELLPLLPDLRALFPSLPAPLAGGASQIRGRVLAALTQTLRALAQRTPVLLCLDDLHWADEGTLSWLHFLAGHWEDAPLVVLVSAHSKSAPALAPLWPAFSRAGRLAEVELGGLSAADVQRLLAAAAPTSPSPQLALRIHQASGGNPFFVLEIVRELQETGELDDPPESLPLPATVRDAIMGRVSHLTPIARQVLEAAAVLDPLLDDALLQHTSARSAAETADALDELLAHQLLHVSPTPAGELAFPHSLMQQAVYRDLTPWRRRLLHGRAGEELSRVQPHNVAALAHHCSEAAAWEAAIGYLQQAARQAVEAAAYETALAMVERAFELLPAVYQPDKTRLALLRQRLALQRVLVRLAGWQSDAAEVLQLGTAAGDSAASLEALEAQIGLHVLLSDFAQAERVGNHALALAQQTGDRVAEARVRQTLGWHLADALGRSREGLAHLEKACRLADEAGAVDVQYLALCNLAFAQRAEGQCEAAKISALQALALTSYRPGDPPRPAFADALRELGEANAYLGRWQEALDLLQPLLELYQTLNDPWAYGAVLHNYGLYCANIGRHQEAIAAMRRLVALSEAVGLPASSDYGIWHRAGLARALLAAGENGEAGELLASLEVGGLTPGRPYLAWTKAAAEYRLAVGDAAAALAIVQPAVDWWRQSTSVHDVDVLLLAAEATLAAGDVALAQELVAEAAACLEPSDMRRYHVRLYNVQYAVTGDDAALAAALAEMKRQGRTAN